MKYCVLICDGMADYNIESLAGKTPMDVANKPVMDSLANDSLAGTVSNVPSDMVPESDTANLAILSYNPKIYSKGRSPLEAVAMGLEMSRDETAFRCNLVTLSEERTGYDNLIMLDHSSDEITTEESGILIDELNNNLGNEDIRFFTGVSYRHCLLWKNAPPYSEFMRPHDILGQRIRDYLPGEPFLSMHKKSREILSNHPVNRARCAKGLRPANSIWLWSPGQKPSLPSFKKKWGLDGTVISAVDLIKGIGLCAGMSVVDVRGATGNINTNYEGKADAAINAFKTGADFVYIHIEAPDECGHRAEIDNKIKAIEYIDSRTLRPVLEYLRICGDSFKLMILPDHPTPIVTRTHAIDPVPFIIYSSEKVQKGVKRFTEESCKQTGFYIEHGYDLMEYMINNRH